MEGYLLMTSGMKGLDKFEYFIAFLRMTVLKEPLMMEAFGECLPYNKAGFKFMHDFLDSMPGNRIYCV